MDGRLQLERSGAVGRLLIGRADKRNAFDQAMWQALPALVTQAMADPSIRVLVLTSAVPGLFCAGADIGEFAAMAHDPAWRQANQAAIREAQLTLTRAVKPTIAAIDGDCIGGGCGLALACDMRVATRHARFGITPARLALVYPLHDTKLLVDVVGPAQAKRLLFTATLIDTPEATRIGLVDLLCDSLPDAIDAITGDIVAAAPATQRAAKIMVRRILDGVSDDDPESMAQFDAAFTTADFREGVAAFLSRRQPRFTGQ